MELIKCSNIRKEYGDRVILKDVNFHINIGERIAIVGNNGAGKTTMANILTGAIEKDGGVIQWNQENLEIGYLHQASYYTQQEFQNLINDRTEKIGDFFHTTKALGIDKIYEWENERLDGLSGGEKTKLALARIWADKPQLLILDEPTNHMDYEGIQWLIQQIRRYPGTVIIISHDRYFMDQTVTKVIEIEDGNSVTYVGNYTTYRDEKHFRYESQCKEYEAQERYKAKINEDIKQLKQWSDKAHRESTKKPAALENKKGGKEFFRMKAKKKDKQIKSKLKRLEKIEVEGLAKPKDEQKITFNFASGDKGGNRILQCKDVSKKYDDKIIFKESSFDIRKGERIALFGRNGCGKTTFIKGVLKELKFDSGDVYLSTSAKIAYLSQDVMNLDDEKTVLEYFGIENYERRGILQILLTNMGFSKSMVHKRIKTLSLGERTRIKVAYMIMMENNVLILDEPTNHLDLHSREMLEKTLQQYEGTIILVSHDRYLLEKLCDKVLAFENGQILRYEYSFEEYLERKHIIKNGKGKKEKSKKKSVQEEIMIIDNRIAAVLGEISQTDPNSDRYKELDDEFKELLREKKELGTVNKN